MRPIHRLAAVLVVVGVLAGACDSRHAWEGRYSGRPDGRDPAGEVTLTLESGGKGRWAVAGESTPLRWEERGGALWLHLNNGGVLTARPIPSRAELALELPGIGSFTLRKAAH
ncbi:MAG: hypothetical protein EHM15_04750 [Desulfobacteraceae bacterium]|nr:MAG: hypothetical protein EHM15_11370 [Desulfobacteraceae bacterium]RPJ74782.1 MAG: hypothetical protein EHM15_04750 [Desulfobacteraceae bacterium]